MSRNRRQRVLAGTLAAVALLLAVVAPAYAQPPSNDDFDAATAFTTLPFTDAVDTTEATTADDDPDCVGNGHTVWYAFTPASDVEVTANTFGSDYDTTLSVYTGTRGALEQIACNDDSGSLQSRVAFDATGGTTYFLMVGSFFDSPGGSLVFNAFVLPPPLELGLTIDPTGEVTRSGVATIHGTLTCSREAPGVPILGTIRQQLGKKVAVSSFLVTIDCDGSESWSATAIGETAAFRKGNAQVVAAINYFDQDRAENVRARATRTVNLR